MKPCVTSVLVCIALVVASVYAVDDDDANSGIRSTSSLAARQAGFFNDFSNVRFRNPAFLRAQNIGTGATDSLSSLGVQSGSLGVQSGLLNSQSLLPGLGGTNTGLLGSSLQGNQLLLSGGQFGTGLDSFGLQNSMGLNNGLGGFNSGFNQNRFPLNSGVGLGSNGLGFNSQFSNPLLNSGVGSSSLLGLQQNTLGLNNGQFNTLGLNNGQFGNMGLSNGQFNSFGLNNGQFNSLGFNNGQLGSSFGFNNGQFGLNNGLGVNGQFGSNLGFSNGLNNGLFNGLGASSQLGFNSGFNNSPFGTSTGLNTLPFNQQSMLFNQNANLGLGLGSNVGLGTNSLGIGALGTNNVRQFRELDSTKNDRTIFNNDIDEHVTLNRPKNGSALNLHPNVFRPPFANNAFPPNVNSMEANDFFNPLLSQLNANQGLGQGAFRPQEGNSNNPVNDIRTLVPGQPNQDYPTFQGVPETGFSCQGRKPGYYADLKTRCQAFHICGLDATGASSKNSFLCPNGTLFNQVNKVCQWWAEVDCSKSEQHFGVNEEPKMPMTTLPPVQTLPSPNFGFQQPTPFPNVFNGAQFQRPFTNPDVSLANNLNNLRNNRPNQNADSLNPPNEKPLFAPPNKRPPFRPSFRPAASTDV